MRRHFTFAIGGDQLHATLDSTKTPHKTGLLIVSGGNEIRSGSHAGQALLAQELARQGFSVMRFDRRGIGDSSGENLGFRGALPDIAAAAAAFREQVPELQSVTAFGNCDAASALALFHEDIGVNALILTNPWTIDDSDTGEENAEADALPQASAIRQRYWQKLKDPRAVLRLVSGNVDMKKLGAGLRRAGTSDNILTDLAAQMAAELGRMSLQTHIILAAQDRTALAFKAAWQHRDFDLPRSNSHIHLHKIDSASHSFADAISSRALTEIVSKLLQHAGDQGVAGTK